MDMIHTLQRKTANMEHSSPSNQLITENDQLITENEQLKEENDQLKTEVMKYQLTYDEETINIKYDQQYAQSLKLCKKIEGEYVYFIRQIRDEPRVKIGFTKSLNSRLIAINTSNSDELEIIGFIKTTDMKTLESEFHDQFHDFKIKGEWYELSEEQVVTILDYYRETGCFDIDV
jgi:hypothetical protein